MSSAYTPELGQMVFGQPSKSYECPPILEVALTMVRHELERVMGNLTQEEPDDPFGNYSASWSCPTFTVCSYSWGEEEQPYNFRHDATGIEVSWYKYFGRGMSVNREVTPQEASDLMIDCIAALRKVEEGETPWTQPGLYPTPSPA